MSVAHYMELALTALTVSVAGTVFVRRVALEAGIVDRSGGHLRIRPPVPLLGGVAVYGAFVLALILFRSRFNLDQLVGILVGATLVSCLGLWDDRRPTSPAVKLGGQLVAAVVIVAAGVRVQLFGVVSVDVVASVLWILYITNAFNLLDNMDGLSAGVASISAAFFLGLAILNGQYLVGPLAAALLGSCVGFLFFNMNPARIFMGDAGSLFIGFVMAALSIKMRFPGQSLTVSWMVPVLVLAVPIIDTAYVSISRTVRRTAFWKGGQDHLSHRLVSIGLQPGRAVLLLHSAGLLFGVSGLIVSVADPHHAWVVAGASAVVALAACVWLDLRARHGLKVGLGRRRS